jgi:2-polyprenyl-3-methyl-5-hydroxy-6-metoxy-1,4-benzoquinol methylase
MQETVSSCPICNSHNFKDIFKSKDYTSSNEIFQLIKCDNCSLIITSPRPNEENIRKYYESIDYISHSAKTESFFNKIYFLARNIAITNKRKLIEQYNPVGKLLDIGCGTGSFIRYMKQNEWEPTGVEPSAKARKIAQETAIDIVEKIEDIKDQKFNVITMWHVLEHIHDVNKTILKIKELLKSDGTLFIAVPNYKSYDAKYYTTTWAAYDVPRHLWHFSQEIIKKLLQKHNLEVISIQPMKMDSFYVSLLSEKNNNPTTIPILRIIKAFIIGLLSNLKAIRTSNYSSLIYIAKKS